MTTDRGKDTFLGEKIPLKEGEGNEASSRARKGTQRPSLGRRRKREKKGEEERGRLPFSVIEED